MNTVVGKSTQMQHVMQRMERLGRHRWPVLLLGETGTGKERIARALHNVDPRGQFVTIDCSSMVGPLMESELFGYAKGAFTGAIGQKAGLIELANGGTAFFDEIGELSLDLQAKLLRVLQEKEFRPVGGLLNRRSEFRVIAATNRNLESEVQRGTFRRDLYYRLNVTNLRLPALRDRGSDVFELIEHFLTCYGRNHEMASETMQILLTYPWPGNVRELENCVKHMVTMNSGPILHNADLPSTIQNYVHNKQMIAMSAAVGSQLSLFDATLKKNPSPHQDGPILPLEEIERREIIRALEFTGGDRMAAARLLRIGRTTLYRKLKAS